ncbi:MAG: single-stranded DNA-binding protein [Proteobacteria bacterium]|jgi:single-strand DNA-binding protein|nr:single-stranded DNA-binding protein [Pseudomonadota bacterium]
MVNKVILVGRLGKDPEVRASQAGKTFCSFTLATDTGFGENRKTDWHNIVVFDKQADNCGRYLKKGSLVYIEGRISYDKYQDKDGQQRTSTRILANTVQFLESKNASSNGYSQNYDPSFDQTRSYGNYGAPAQPAYNAPAQPAYGAPAQQSASSAPAASAAPEFSTAFGDDDIPF